MEEPGISPLLTPGMVLIQSLGQIMTCSYHELHDTLKHLVPNLKIRKKILLSLKEKKSFDRIEFALTLLESTGFSEQMILDVKKQTFLPSSIEMNRELKEYIPLKRFMSKNDMNADLSKKPLLAIKKQRDRLFKDISESVEARILNHIERDLSSVETALKTLNLVEL